MPRVVHFEFNADDPERAVRFYSGVFGWDIQKWAGPADYWLASTGAGVGIDGAMQAAPEFVGGQRTVVTMDVESVDDVAAKVEAAGGSVVLPKMAIPNVGWLIYCRDTEGMLFGAMQSDESASAEPAPDRAAAPAGGDGSAGGDAPGAAAGAETSAAGGDEAATGADEPAARDDDEARGEEPGGGRGGLA